MNHSHVIQSNPVIQLMLNCQFGSSKVDRRIGYVWLSEVMTGFLWWDSNCTPIIRVYLIRNKEHSTLGTVWAALLRHRRECGLAWLMEGYVV